MIDAARRRAQVLLLRRVGHLFGVGVLRAAHPHRYTLECIASSS